MMMLQVPKEKVKITVDDCDDMLIGDDFHNTLTTHIFNP